MSVQEITSTKLDMGLWKVVSVGLVRQFLGWGTALCFEKEAAATVLLSGFVIGTEI